MKLLQFDGVALLKHRNSLNLEKTSYYCDVILVDERRFLHEESGSSPVQKDPPAIDIPNLEALEWRRLALEVGGVEHAIIRDGKAAISIPDEVWKEWKQWTGEVDTSI